jgi:DNA polymerase IV
MVSPTALKVRHYGVHSAMPISEAARRLPPETVYVPPSMVRYARVSRQIMDALETISPLVEKVSIWTPTGRGSVGEPFNGV